MTEREAKRGREYVRWRDNFRDHVCTPQPSVGEWKTWDCGAPGTGMLAFTMLIGPGAIIITGDVGNLMLHPNTKTHLESLKWLKGRFGENGSVAEDYLLEKARPVVQKCIDPQILEEYLKSGEFLNIRSRKGERALSPDELQDAADLFRQCETASQFEGAWWSTVDIDSSGDVPDVLDVDGGTLMRIEALRWFSENEGKAGTKRYSVAWTEQHCAVVRSIGEDEILLQINAGDIEGMLYGNNVKRHRTFEAVTEVIEIVELPVDG